MRGELVGIERFTPSATGALPGCTWQGVLEALLDLGDNPLSADLCYEQCTGVWQTRVTCTGGLSFKVAYHTQRL